MIETKIETRTLFQLRGLEWMIGSDNQIVTNEEAWKASQEGKEVRFRPSMPISDISEFIVSNVGAHKASAKTMKAVNRSVAFYTNQKSFETFVRFPYMVFPTEVERFYLGEENLAPEEVKNLLPKGVVSEKTTVYVVRSGDQRSVRSRSRWFDTSVARYRGGLGNRNVNQLIFQGGTRVDPEKLDPGKGFDGWVQEGSTTPGFGITTPSSTSQKRYFFFGRFFKDGNGYVVMIEEERVLESILSSLIFRLSGRATEFIEDSGYVPPPKRKSPPLRGGFSKKDLESLAHLQHKMEARDQSLAGGEEDTSETDS